MSRSGFRGAGDWTAEAVARLLALKGEGLSAGQIVKAMRADGRTVTRSAVIGKLARLREQGIMPPDAPEPTPAPERFTPLAVAAPPPAPAASRRAGVCAAAGCSRPAQKGYPDGLCAECRRPWVAAQTRQQRAS